MTSTEFPIQLKLIFLSGLKEIVKKELSLYMDVKIIDENDQEIYIDNIIDFNILNNLKSVLKVCVSIKSEKLNPVYIYKHKSVLGNMIEKVLTESNDKFKSFKINCAGSDSTEITKINEYIKDTYKLIESEKADLKIYIIKPDNLWEIAIQISSKPLSFRDYKLGNIEGGINSTIAYAMNTFIDLNNIQSYINIFSGSATLLIEAGLINPNLKLVGFDKNKKSNSIAIQNIKKAGLIKSIQLKTADIFDKPSVGKFDVITSDLPFGMMISKGEDLEKLYEQFIKYSEEILNNGGKLIVYTSEYKVFDRMISKSKFIIKNDLSVRVLAKVNTYLNTKIFVCEFKD
jgi:precorrin-6B methylase 2